VWERERSLYSIRSLTFSQCRDLITGVMCRGVGRGGGDDGCQNTPHRSSAVFSNPTLRENVTFSISHCHF